MSGGDIVSLCAVLRRSELLVIYEDPHRDNGCEPYGPSENVKDSGIVHRS